MNRTILRTLPLLVAAAVALAGCSSGAGEPPTGSTVSEAAPAADLDDFGDILLGLDDGRRVAGDETLTGAPEMLDPKRAVDAGGGIAGAPPVCAHNLDEAARFGGSWRLIGWFPVFGANHVGNRGALWLALYADATEARRVFDAYVAMVDACAATGHVAYPGSVKRVDEDTVAFCYRGGCVNVYRVTANAVMETSAFEFIDDENVAASWAEEMSDRIGRRW